MGALLVAGIPGSGVLPLIVLVVGIAQIPALLVTLPAIGYMWHAGMHDPGMAMAYSILLLVASSTDMVLKPLLFGRSVTVDAPIPIILFGALGGLATDGILGMFVGATVIALGYQVFKFWVNTTPDPTITKPSDSQADPSDSSVPVLRSGRRYLLEF